jgi:hypothetical protein
MRATYHPGEQKRAHYQHLRLSQFYPRLPLGRDGDFGRRMVRAGLFNHPLTFSFPSIFFNRGKDSHFCHRKTLFWSSLDQRNAKIHPSRAGSLQPRKNGISVAL